MKKWFCYLLILGQLSATELQFNRDIRPILSDKCFGCHGPSKERKADLRLDTFEGATDSERKGGAALVPGRATKSLVYQRLITKDEHDVMPPVEHHKSLTEEEIDNIKIWINQGAKYQKHWSFMPLKNTPLIKGNLVDHYISNHHKVIEGSFNSRADKRTLLRRLALDLTGLPPKIDDLHAFLDDKSEQAYKKYIEQYLYSEHYGEHMARTWLDLVRYGDTHGLHGDNYREMYLYRDWVIKAYQKNMPFDQFVIEQIAGDLLPKPSQDQLIASGFNRLHLSNSAGSALREELYVNNVTDRVNAFGTIFMGLTLGCAACHDHKYDPISQKEYYQLFAFFNNLDGDPDNKGVKSPLPALTFPTPEQSEALLKYKSTLNDLADKKEKGKVEKKIKAIKTKVVSTMIMKERATPRPAYILNRGQYDQKGEQVYRNTPEILPAFSKDLPLNRLGLAKWITADDHPLLARLTVNRLWQQLFGIGLFKTSQDLGSQGEWPKHPELLDALALELIKSGWNIKHILKLIVTSRTYQQSSHDLNENYQLDLDNRNLTRGPRFRMDAEMLRDQAMSISGLLVNKKYGRSVKVPQPPGLWEAVALKGSNTKAFRADKGDDIYRKSLYTFWKRSLPPPAMTIFNAPTREVCTSRRERTNTPLQALVLMNEPQFFKAALQLGKWAQTQPGSSKEKITRLYEKVTCLLPETQELNWILKTFEELKQQESETFSWTMIANTLLNLDITKSKG